VTGVARHVTAGAGGGLRFQGSIGGGEWLGRRRRERRRGGRAREQRRGGLWVRDGRKRGETGDSETDARHSTAWSRSAGANYKMRASVAVPHPRSPSHRAMSSFADDRSTACSPLRRTGSFLSLSDLSGSCSRLDPYVSVQGFIDNREKPFKRLNRSQSSSGNSKSAPRVTKPETPPTYYHTHSPKTPSPLSGLHQATYETYRPSFPRSKPQPDLYKLAITAHMRSSIQTQQERESTLEQHRRQQLDAGFRIGSPLAVSIMNATRDLEVLVASQQQQRDADGDVPMTDCPASSWITVNLPGEDWEMVDCCC